MSKRKTRAAGRLRSRAARLQARAKCLPASRSSSQVGDSRIAAETLSVVVELVNPQGVAVVPSLGSVTFCNNFDAKFTVPSSVAPGGYRVLLRFPAEPGRPAPRPTTSREVLTVTRPAGEGNLSGIANCGRGALPGALVELFSGHTFVTSTLAMEPDGRFVFNVAPGQYSVRIQRKTEVCGGPAIAPNPRVPVQPLLDLGNHSWPRAFRMTLTGGTTKSATADEHLFLQDQSAWFKFRIQPGSQVTVTLTGGLAAADPLPENYDLTLYKDIAAAFKELNSQEDLVQLQAESAPDAFTPDAFTPDAFTPDAFTPDAFTPDAFTPDAFTPDAFTPDAFTPDAFTPDAFTPDAFTPDAFTPDAFTPDAFTPDAFTDDAFLPDAFTDGEVSPEAFAGAQTRSLIAVSAFNGTSGEGVRRNTWDNTTDFYVRVRGRNGAFSLAAPFHLTVTMDSAECEQVAPITQGGIHTPSGPNFKTLILTDLGRLAGTPTEKSSLVDEIESFALLPEVGGKFVNFETGDKRIEDARLQADGHPACPFAKNVLAGEIKRLIDSYRALNPGLEYIVLIGNDEVVPFFRDPDEAGLASEKMYAPTGSRYDGVPGQPQVGLRAHTGQVWSAPERLTPEPHLPHAGSGSWSADRDGGGCHRHAPGVSEVDEWSASTTDERARNWLRLPGRRGYGDQGRDDGWTRPGRNDAYVDSGELASHRAIRARGRQTSCAPNYSGIATM